MEEIQQSQEPTEVKIGNFWASIAHDKVIAAFVDALGEIESAVKDSLNPHLRNKYADLSSCLSVVKPALKKNGLALSQPPQLALDMRSLTIGNVVMHKSGQYIRWDLLMPFSAPLSPQEVGKTITYARRYSLSGVGIMTDDDDDGNSGSNVTAPRQNAAPPPRRETPPPPAQPAKPTAKKPEAKVEEKQEVVTELGAFLSAADDQSELKAIINQICQKYTAVTETQVQKFLSTSGISEQPMELQVKYLSTYADNRDFAVVATQWKRTGKTFEECFNEALEKGPDQWRESLKTA